LPSSTLSTKIENNIFSAAEEDEEETKIILSLTAETIE